MLSVALLVICFPFFLQTCFGEAICCDSIKSDIEKRNMAYNVLCSEGDSSFKNCCRVIKEDLPKRQFSYRILCPNHALKSCAALYKTGVREDGVYTIDPDGLGSFPVRCDMTQDGGGWTLFQRRQDGSQDFYRGWSDYKTGFGDLYGEFWLGLDKIHRLSKSGQNALRIDIMDFNGARRYAKYESFSVANESDKYRINIGKFSGDAGDSLNYHNRKQFSTKDTGNAACAVTFRGAWWYQKSSCYKSSLNGRYLGASWSGSGGIVWGTFEYKSLKKTEMKTRPSRF